MTGGRTDLGSESAEPGHVLVPGPLRSLNWRTRLDERCCCCSSASSLGRVTWRPTDAQSNFWSSFRRSRGEELLHTRLTSSVGGVLVRFWSGWGSVLVWFWSTGVCIVKVPQRGFVRTCADGSSSPERPGPSDSPFFQLQALLWEQLDLWGGGGVGGVRSSSK